MLACFIAMRGLEHFARQASDYLLLLSIAFAAYIAAIIAVKIRENTPKAILIVGLFALLFRMALIGTLPTLSDDVWRYLWDGHLLNAGINPYSYRVDDSMLDALDTGFRPRIDHAWMASPYPPMAQTIFGLTVHVAPESTTAMQVIFALFDLLTGLLIALLLRQMGRSMLWAIIYLWNPMIIVEFAHSAHIDSLMTFFIVAALYAYTRNRKVLSIIALACATLTKFIPLLLVPVFFRWWKMKGTAIYGVLVLAAFVPFISAGLGLIQNDGTGIFGAIRIYMRQWQTNDGLFYWLNIALGDVTRPLTSTALVGVCLLVLIRLWRQTERPPIAQIINNAALIISAYLLLTAAMFPWYLTWLIMLFPILSCQRRPSAFVFIVAWLYFSYAVNYSYLFYLDPSNPIELEWVRHLEYLPLFALLIISTIFWFFERHPAFVAPTLNRFGQGERQHKTHTD